MDHPNESGDDVGKGDVCAMITDMIFDFLELSSQLSRKIGRENAELQNHDSQFPTAYHDPQNDSLVMIKTLYHQKLARILQGMETESKTGKNFMDGYDFLDFLTGEMAAMDQLMTRNILCKLEILLRDFAHSNDNAYKVLTHKDCTTWH